jgi:hypothetical protein
VYWRIILKLIFKKWDGEAWTWLIWVRIGAGDSCVCVQMRGISRPAKDLLAAQTGPCSMELISVGIHYVPMLHLPFNVFNENTVSSVRYELNYNVHNLWSFKGNKKV